MLQRSVPLLGLVVLAGLACGCGPTMPKTTGPPLIPTRKAEAFTNPTGITFVVLPVGTVESPGYDIELRRPVLISACEVTNAQYEKFAPGHKRAKVSPGDDCPVVNVTAEEARAFCRWLTENDPMGRVYKLPDLAEWEYAARGGLNNRFYSWGDEIDDTKACYAADRAKPVGSYPPNEFGLYDVAGNAAEWVRTDDFPDYALRGGAWCDSADALRTTSFGPFPEGGQPLDHQGFRVLCEPPPLE